MGTKVVVVVVMVGELVAVEAGAEVSNKNCSSATRCHHHCDPSHVIAYGFDDQNLVARTADCLQIASQDVSVYL